MNEPVFAAGKNEFRVGSERTFDDGGFVEEIGKFVHLIALESVQQHDAVIGSGQYNHLSVITELHNLNLVEIFPPISKRPRFAIGQPIQTNPDNLFIFLLDRPRHSETNPRGIEVSHGVVGHALGVDI